MTVLASVEVEVTGKLNPLEQALADSKREVTAFEKEATDSMNKVGDAANRAGDKVSKAAKESSDAMDVLREAMGDSAKAADKAGTETGQLADKERKLAKEANDAAKAMEREAREARKLASANDNLADQTDEAADAQRRLNNAQDNTSRGAKQLGQAIGQTLGQFASGTPSVDALGNAAMRGGGALLRMGPAAAAAGGLVAGLAAAVVVGTIAWDKYEQSTEQAELALYGAGRAAGMTVSDFQANAEAAADMANVSINAARDMEAAFLQAGVSNSAIMVDLIDVTNDYARVTGQEAAAAAQELGAAFADPIAGAEMLEERFGYLDQRSIELIRTMVQQNNLAGAQAELLRILQGEVGGAAEEVRGLAAAWQAVARWATNAFNAMGKEISLTFGGGTTEDRLQRLYERRDSPAEIGMRARTGMGDRAINEEIRLLEARRDQERQAAATAAAERERNRAAAEGQQAFDALIPQERQRATILGQIADIERAQAQGTMSAANATRALTEARRRLNAIDNPRSGAARGGARGGGANSADQLARQAEQMRINTDAAFELADAYMESASAGAVAEARRQALTQATRAGMDVEAQAARQLLLNIAQASAQGARRVATMREEATAQRIVNDSVVNGSQSLREAQEWLEIDQAQRELHILALSAEGEVREQLEQIIDGLGRAVEDLNREQARSRVIQQTENLRNQNAVMEKELRLLGATNDERREAIAQLQALQFLQGQGIDPNSPEGVNYRNEVSRGTRAEGDKERGDFMERARDSVEQQTRAFREQAAVYGMTFREAERYRKERELLNEAEDRGITLTDAQREEIARLAEAYGIASDEARKLEAQQKAVADAAEYAASTLYDFFDEIVWGSGDAEDALKNLVKALSQAVLQATLLGQGPLAGIFGTSSNSAGNGPGGILNVFAQWAAGGFGGFGGGSGPPADLAGLYHSGTRSGGVGAPSTYRAVNPAIFHRAPRLHDGLKPDEFPAILQRGERVTPKGGGRREAPLIGNVTIQAADLGSFQRSERQIAAQLGKAAMRAARRSS